MHATVFLMNPVLPKNKTYALFFFIFLEITIILINSRHLLAA